MKSQNLITRLNIAIFVLAVFPTILISVLSYFASIDTINKAISRFGLEMEGLHRASFHVDQYIKENTQMAVSLSRQEKFLSAGDWEKRKIINDFFINSISVKQVKYFDENGKRILNVLLEEHSGVEEVQEDPQWLHTARQWGLSNNTVFFVKDYPWINITVPVREKDDHAPSGYLSVYFSLKPVLNQLEKDLKKESGICYILDKKGRIVYADGESKEEFGEISPGLYSNRAADGGLEIETLNKQKGVYLASYMSVGDTGWQLIWKYRLEEIISTSANILFNFLGSLMLSLLFAILISRYVVRRLGKPLEGLMIAVENMADGIYDQEVALLKEADEMGALAKSFENMRKRFRQFAEDSRKQYSQTREKLEKRVEELQTIHSVTEAFASIDAIPDLLNYIVQHIKEIFPVKFCNLYLKDDNDKFTLRAFKGPATMKFEQYFQKEFPLHKEPFNTLQESLQAIVISDLSSEGILTDVYPVSEVGSYCVFPLYRGAVLFGILEVAMIRGSSPVQGSIRLLTTLAKEASIAILNARLYKRMQEEKQKMEIILSTVSDGVFSMDENCIIESFNPAAEIITGYKKEEVIGKCCFNIFQGVQNEGDIKTMCRQNKCILKIAYDQERMPIVTEHTVKTPRGEEKTLEFASSVEKNSEGNITFVSIIRDVSKIREIEKLRSNFIDTISHELRTPLTSIKGYISTLLHPRANFSKEESREFLTIIHEETNRLNRLINTLLEASKLHRDALIIKPQPFRLTPLVEEVARRYQTTTKSHQILVQIEGTPVVYGDPQQLEFVFAHIVENAIKYSPDGGEIKILTLSSGQEEKEMLQVIIEDQGLGVPEDQREKIFNIFHRVDNRSTRRIYGPGLGLFLSRKIIEAHNCKIWVEAGLQGGSRFVFCLPKFKGEIENSCSL